MLRLTFSTRDLALIRFAYSPLWEVIASIRVLKSPTEHPLHRRWIDRVRPRLASLEAGLLWELVPVPTVTLPPFIAPPPRTSAPDLDTELAALTGTASAQLRAELASVRRPFGSHLASLYADPSAGLARLADEIRRYWDVALAPDWPRIKTLCESDVLYRARIMAESGVERMFSELSPQISWREETLSIDHLYVDRTVRCRGRGLILVPSVFISPRVFSLSGPERQSMVRYPPRGIALLWTSRDRPLPVGLAKVLGRTRARIVAELDEPLATTDLAMRCGLTAGGVSQQLGLLYQAGLVQRHRAGRLVLYARSTAAETLLAAGT